MRPLGIFTSDSNWPTRQRMEAAARDFQRRRQMDAAQGTENTKLRAELTQWRAEATRLKLRVLELEAKMAPEIAEPLFPVGSVKAIQKVVAEAYDLTVLELLSHRRPVKYMLPRRIAIYLSRELTTQSMPQIGWLFDRRDHTTVLRICRNMDICLAADPAFAKQVGALKALCLKAFAERVAV